MASFLDATHQPSCSISLLYSLINSMHSLHWPPSGHDPIKLYLRVVQDGSFLLTLRVYLVLLINLWVKNSGSQAKPFLASYQKACALARISSGLTIFFKKKKKSFFKCPFFLLMFLIQKKEEPCNQHLKLFVFWAPQWAFLQLLC